MKRAAAAGLCAALLCGMCAPAYAADTAKPAQTTTTAQTEVKAPVKLTFDTLEKTVREGNVSIRSYQQTVESAEKTDVSDQYINKYFNLSQQIDAYDKQISSLKKSRDSIKDDALKASITAQISVLQATRDSLYQQYKNLDDDEDDAKDEQKKTVDSTRRQMQNNADTICLSAENNYISLASMQIALMLKDKLYVSLWLFLMKNTFPSHVFTASLARSIICWVFPLPFGPVNKLTILSSLLCL